MLTYVNNRCTLGLTTNNTYILNQHLKNWYTRLAERQGDYMLFTIETEDIEIEYEITNESFDHAFGTRRISGYEITKIMAYIPALNDWMDVSHLEAFGVVADKLVEKQLEGAA